MDPNVTTNDEPTSVQSRKYLIRVRTATDEYEGLFHSPFPDKRLSDVLTRMEQFINLKEVRDVASGETFPFMVISKASIQTIKVVEEWIGPPRSGAMAG